MAVSATSVPIAGTPARLHVSGQDMWVTSDDARTVSRVDAGSPAIARVLPVGASIAEDFPEAPLSIGRCLRRLWRRTGNRPFLRSRRNDRIRQAP